MNTLEIIYSIIAVIFIIWQGYFWYEWHPFDPKPKKIQAKEILLNSLGSVVGWGAGYYFLFHRLQIIIDNFNPSIADLVLFLIAFYGMTGYLPHVLINKLNLGK